MCISWGVANTPKIQDRRTVLPISSAQAEYMLWCKRPSSRLTAYRFRLRRVMSCLCLLTYIDVNAAPYNGRCDAHLLEPMHSSDLSPPAWEVAHRWSHVRQVWTYLSPAGDNVWVSYREAWIRNTEAYYRMHQTHAGAVRPRIYRRFYFFYEILFFSSINKNYQKSTR